LLPWRKGKGNILSLAFFLLFLRLPECYAQQPGNLTYPVITRMDTRDTGFRQYINEVESNRRRLRLPGRLPEETAEYLTIFQYTPASGEDIFSIAARCNIPYSAMASLNRLNNPLSLEAGKPLLLPSCPGIFISASLETDLEKLLGAGRLTNSGSSPSAVEIKIRRAGKAETYYFYPGDDFTPTERTFFLNSGMRFPLRSFRVTSDFGLRPNPVTGNIVMHQGLDLAAPEGTEVYAVSDGTVIDIGYDRIYGNYIIIRHKDNLTSLYGHLQRVEAVLRTQVKSGTLIGRVGSTGQSTGPHLHFELRQDGRALDPAGRLRR
jgi:murein DD-endopeptidase MepM/ murein hydrolase activator NlpD